MKATADDKINVTEKVKFVVERVEKMFDINKMLATSVFSFSHNVFYVFKDYNFEKPLTLSQKTNFRLFQNERVRKQQFQI